MTIKDYLKMNGLNENDDIRELLPTHEVGPDEDEPKDHTYDQYLYNRNNPFCPWGY